MSGAELELFRPYRVVTAGMLGYVGLEGWHQTRLADGSLKYRASRRHNLGGWPWTLAELIQNAAQVRAVDVAPSHEYELIRAALMDAGNQAVTTLAVALHRCSRVVGSAGLVAGRPGSWESRVLVAFAEWGARVQADRVHEQAADAVHWQLLEWTTGPQRYVELAETLSGLFSETADAWINQALGDRAGQVTPRSDVLALAWQSVADRRLWPDAYEGNAIGAEWYRYLMKGSHWFSPAWFEQWATA